MTIQFSTDVRNARADAIETEIGTSAVLKIFTGSPPANCAAADSGTLLAQMSLPSDWMNDAAGAAKSKNGTWEDSSANATGTAGHFRIYESTVTTCHVQGTVTATGGGGDIELDTTSITSGGNIQISTFTFNEGNA